MSTTPVIKRTPLSITQQEASRKAHAKASHFDPAWISEGGSVFIVLTCGHTTPAFRENYEGIFGEEDIFKNLKD